MELLVDGDQTMIGERGVNLNPYPGATGRHGLAQVGSGGGASA